MGTLPTYDADQLAAVLALLPDVDAVELKLTVPDADQRRVLGSLGIDSLDAEIRQVAFFDTPDLRLSAAGLVVRARRTQRKPGDVTVKLRPMLPDEAPEGLRTLRGFKVEVDASPAGFTCSCSLTAEVSDRKVKRLFAGTRTLDDVLDRDQRDLLAARLPDGVAPADLRVLGPVHLLKGKFAPKGYPRRMVAEVWFLPDGGRILELSTKAEPAQALQAAAETKVFLAGRGIDLDAPQEAKTQTALAVFAATLAQE
ncbi:hypothetical protein [Nocardioides sp. W7]|uniref:hypothetical protein n=1 Tax=Nocardioides sp. W7 TaxID=2931390 RepID=UPI001FD20F57|nr:hypothetical protein [Nocardioides sp. W7]